MNCLLKTFNLCFKKIIFYVDTVIILYELIDLFIKDVSYYVAYNSAYYSPAFYREAGRAGF
jgi:hypothetical protein